MPTLMLTRTTTPAFGGLPTSAKSGIKGLGKGFYKHRRHQPTPALCNYELEGRMFESCRARSLCSNLSKYREILRKALH
jgi:hypothetical protein